MNIFRSIYKKPRSDTVKGKYIFVLPAATGVQGPGRALITSHNCGFYLGEKVNTSLSEYKFTPYFNLKEGRYGVPMGLELRWNGNNNSWNMQGDTRFVVSTYTWGLVIAPAPAIALLRL